MNIFQGLLQKEKSTRSKLVDFNLCPYEQIIWSESHTGYELCSLSRNIIYKLLLNFNGGMENFIIL